MTATFHDSHRFCHQSHDCGGNWPGACIAIDFFSMVENTKRDMIVHPAPY
jgi:hypothetical protein